MSFLKNKSKILFCNGFKHQFIGQVSCASTASLRKVEQCYKTLSVKKECTDEEMKVKILHCSFSIEYLVYELLYHCNGTIFTGCLF